MHTLLKKISALIKAKQKLEEGADYFHGTYGKCNCGIVAQVVTGLSSKRIAEAFSDSELNNRVYLKTYGPVFFYAMAEESCSVTGMPINDIVSTLSEWGFTFQDLKELELLSNKKYNTGGYQMDSKTGLINYLENWIADLQSQVYRNDITASLAVLPVDETADQPVKQLV